MKQSELLRKQADMIDLAEKYGIDDWRKLVTVYTHERGRETLIDPNYILATYADPKFALGVVEGKPVFEGDVIWQCSRKFIADETLEEQMSECRDISCFSWNPPKPKTILVELLVEDAKELIYAGDYPYQSELRISEACRKALEAIK